MESLRRDRPLVHCPYCKGGFDDPRDLVACAPCGARHHLECFREIDRCATCGARDALAHRDGVRRDLERKKLRALRFFFVVLAITTTAVFLTYSWTVNRNATAPTRTYVAEQEQLAGERGDLERRRHQVEADSERLRAQHAGWLNERAEVLKATALERENARQLAREGWRIAELIAQAQPFESGSLARLRDALRAVPEGPSVLREALEERISNEESLRTRPVTVR